MNLQYKSLSQSNGPINAYCRLKERPLTLNSSTPQYTGWKTDKFSIKINNADNCVEMKNGSFVLLENIATSKIDTYKILVIGRCYEKIQNFFTTPCSSQLLNIHEVHQLGSLQSWPLEDVVNKLVRLPLYSDKVVLIPFAHDT